jgi:hypothetical protein
MIIDASDGLEVRLAQREECECPVPPVGRILQRKEPDDVYAHVRSAGDLEDRL